MGELAIKVPDIGEGIAEVELVAWWVQPGDPVAEDQVLADVMTDKATVELPSPVAGKVLSLGGTVGQLIAVGAELTLRAGAEIPQSDRPVAADRHQAVGIDDRHAAHLTAVRCEAAPGPRWQIPPANQAVLAG